MSVLYALSNEEATNELTGKRVKEFISPATLEQVAIVFAASLWGITEDELKDGNNTFAEFRYSVIYALKNTYYSEFTWMKLGAVFNLDHSTAIYGFHRIRKLVEQDRKRMAFRDLNLIAKSLELKDFCLSRRKVLPNYSTKDKRN